MSAYSTAVLADSPDVYYRLDETGSGAGAFVDVANAHNATPNATIVSSASLLPQDADASATLDSAATFFKATTIYTVAQQPLTVEFWVKPTALSGGFSTILSCGGAGDGWNVAFYADGRWVFTEPGIINGFFNSSPIAAAATTQHVVFVLHGSTPWPVDLYINGVTIESVNVGTTMNATTSTLTIGEYNGADRMRGVVDEIAIYKATLSAGRILAHYQAGTISSALYTPARSMSVRRS